MKQFDRFSAWSGRSCKLGFKINWNTKNQCWTATSSKRILGEYFPLIEKGYLK